MFTLSKGTYNLFVNIALLLIWGSVIILIIQRVMESKGLKYLVEKTAVGFEFSYKLGLYAGKIVVRRDPLLEYPKVSRKPDGWDLGFPLSYSDKDVKAFIMRMYPKDSTNKSHSQDFEILREVVFKNNDSLKCIGGKVFTEDRRKTPRP